MSVRRLAVCLTFQIFYVPIFFVLRFFCWSPFFGLRAGMHMILPYEFLPCSVRFSFFASMIPRSIRFRSVCLPLLLDPVFDSVHACVNICRADIGSVFFPVFVPYSSHCPVPVPNSSRIRLVLISHSSRFRSVFSRVRSVYFIALVLCVLCTCCSVFVSFLVPFLVPFWFRFRSVFVPLSFHRSRLVELESELEAKVEAASAQEATLNRR